LGKEGSFLEKKIIQAQLPVFDIKEDQEHDVRTLSQNGMV